MGTRFKDWRAVNKAGRLAKKLSKGLSKLEKREERDSVSKGGSIRTKKQAGGIHDPRNKLTTAQKRFYGGKQRDFTPLSQNDPDKNVRKKRPGGFATGGPAVVKAKAIPASGGKRVSSLAKGFEPKVKPKPKKQRGYGQAQEGRGGYSKGGSVASRLSKAGPVAKPN